MQDFSHEAARLHAKLPAHRRAVERALGRVRQALTEAPGPWAVACSGGKDSTALLTVCLEAGWRGPVFHFAYRGDYDQEPTDHAAAMASKNGLPFARVDVMSEMEAIDAIGSDCHDPGHRGQDALKAAARLWGKTYQAELNAFQNAQGWAGTFIGMRAEESAGRRAMFRQKGHTYSTVARDHLTCCPLFDWSGRDVWGWILSHQVPYLRRYDEADDRVWSRSDDAWLVGGAWSHGTAARIRSQDIQLWTNLVERYPMLKDCG